MQKLSLEQEYEGTSCSLKYLGRQETHTILPHEVMLREEEASWLARVLHMLQCTQSPVDFDMVSTQANGLKPSVCTDNLS